MIHRYFNICILLTLQLCEIAFSQSKPHFEGAYLDISGGSKVAMVLKFDKISQSYSGALLDQISKSTYAIDLTYLEGDSIMGNLYSTLGVAKQFAGKFDKDVLKIQIKIEELDIHLQTYQLKRYSHKPVFDRSKLAESKRKIDSKLVGRWIEWDDKNNRLSQNIFWDFLLDGTYSLSYPSKVSGQFKEYVKNGVVIPKWFTERDVLVQYYESTIPTSFSISMDCTYKINSDTLFLTTNLGKTTKYIKDIRR